MGASAGAAAKARPNVVVIMTDDQRWDSMRLMPNVERLIGDQGATFENSFVNFPLCCPSRATFLTGQYAHNHGVMGNNGPDGGYHALDSSNTLPVWLQRAGYYTGHIGKYLNGYGRNKPKKVPDGWSEWHGSIDPTTYRYYGYTLNEAGSLITYGTQPQDYSTDVYTDKAVDFIQRRAPSTKPFFLSLGYLAPHVGGKDDDEPTIPDQFCDNAAKPAPRHLGTLAGAPLPQPPSFNEEDVSDKPTRIRDLPLLSEADVSEIKRLYECRSESLLAENEGVARIMDALAASGELANTLVVFTSDNGYFQGEHRIKNGKSKAYEESIRVPLMIRGPHVPAGVTVHDMAINADLAPTILDETGASAGLDVDGRSLIPFARRPDRWHGRELPVEHTVYDAIRTRRYLYIENDTGEKELYDLQSDPYELQSLHADSAYAGVQRALARRLRKLSRCEGDTCRRSPRLEIAVESRKGLRGGRRCAKRPILMRIAGKDRRKPVAVRLVVGGHDLGEISEPPFERALPVRYFRRGAKTKLAATVDLLDGRRITLDRRIRACR